MALRNWVRLPTDWIQDRGLQAFRWSANRGAAHTAALMCLTAIAHHADEETGAAKLTYDQIQTCTMLSRATVSAGLTVLEERGIITRAGARRSLFNLTGYKLAGGWGKLPAKGLYAFGRIAFFNELGLRKPVELNALKLYLLFVARRGSDTNLANISYDKIEEYTDINRDRIKPALSLLAANALIHVEHIPSDNYGFAQAYRLVHLDPRRHMGTAGRQLLASGDTSASADT